MGRRNAEIGSVCAAVVLSVSIASVAAAQDQDRVGLIGLLFLPEVFGTARGCDVAALGEKALYSAPESGKVIGWLRPDKDAEASNGNCYGVTASVHRTDGTVAEVPVEEYREEDPRVAIVLEHRGRWFKIRLEDGAAWLKAAENDRYLPLEDLLRQGRQAYLTDAWDGRLATRPGGTRRRVSDDTRRLGHSNVWVNGFRRVRGVLWLRVGVMSHTIYESDEPTPVVATGWVPAHAATGDLVVWFYSRD